MRKLSFPERFVLVGLVALTMSVPGRAIALASGLVGLALARFARDAIEARARDLSRLARGGAATLAILLAGAHLELVIRTRGAVYVALAIVAFVPAFLSGAAGRLVRNGGDGPVELPVAAAVWFAIRLAPSIYGTWSKLAFVAGVLVSIALEARRDDEDARSAV